MTDHISAEQYRKEATTPKRSKYRNVPTVIDNIRFASKREAAYYQELKLREKAGEVYEIELQRRYALTAPNGMLLATYIADMVFYDAVQRKTRVVDVKGKSTDMFILKRKMMRGLLGIEVEVVK